jgi:hypothetical protein
LFILH